jgi:hypothetical protein
VAVQEHHGTVAVAAVLLVRLDVSAASSSAVETSRRSFLHIATQGVDEDDAGVGCQR